ncbi:MAG: site-specific DNA-methyltransferase, partial [Alphaproteobacteria bacterium]|nr:site-specific DNA-methyltransferase [Alphaproteobacteria bacterium]
PFPLVLPLRAIYSVMNEEKGVVIDPYCGSGTTLVAAKLLGHKCIGIDASREYLHMSYDRLKNFERERGVWLAECALHTVQESAAEKRKAGKYAGKFSPHAPAQRKQSRQKDLLRHSES